MVETKRMAHENARIEFRRLDAMPAEHVGDMAAGRGDRCVALQDSNHWILSCAASSSA